MAASKQPRQKARWSKRSIGFSLADYRCAATSAKGIFCNGRFQSLRGWKGRWLTSHGIPTIPRRNSLRHRIVVGPILHAHTASKLLLDVAVRDGAEFRSSLSHRPVNRRRCKSKSRPKLTRFLLTSGSLTRNSNRFCYSFKSLSFALGFVEAAGLRNRHASDGAGGLLGMFPPEMICKGDTCIRWFSYADDPLSWPEFVWQFQGLKGLACIAAGQKPVHSAIK